MKNLYFLDEHQDYDLVMNRAIPTERQQNPHVLIDLDIYIRRDAPADPFPAGEKQSCDPA